MHSRSTHSNVPLDPFVHAHDSPIFFKMKSRNICCHENSLLNECSLSSNKNVSAWLGVDMLTSYTVDLCAHTHMHTHTHTDNHTTNNPHILPPLCNLCTKWAQLKSTVTSEIRLNRFLVPLTVKFLSSDFQITPQGHRESGLMKKPHCFSQNDWLAGRQTDCDTN